MWRGIFLLTALLVSGCQKNSTYVVKGSDVSHITGNLSEQAKDTPSKDMLSVYLSQYNSRGGPLLFYSEPSTQPKQLAFSKQFNEVVDQKLGSTALVSYLMYEKGEVIIDQISPEDRFGDQIDNNTMLFSMSLGKSLTGYLLGHAICQGYIEGIETTFADWPLLADTLFENQTLQAVINARSGDQEHASGAVLRKLNAQVDTQSISGIAALLKGSKPGVPTYNYGALPANIVLNYIAFKTGAEFQQFLDGVLQDHAGIEGVVQISSHGGSSLRQGVLNAQFKAKRYDYLRLAIAILEDWKSDNCVGRYMKEVYANRQKKDDGLGGRPSFATGYGAFFHTDYKGMKGRNIMGMDGYGGIALLIDFDAERIIYAHAVHDNYDYERLVLRTMRTGVLD